MHDPQLLQRTAELAARFLETLPDRHVGSRATLEELRAALGRPLTNEGVDPATVIDDLAADADPGILASAGPRFFGFVIGGSVPAALAADWLRTSATATTGFPSSRDVPAESRFTPPCARSAATA